MTERTVTCPDITCGHCTATIKRELEELEGVSVTNADPETKAVTIRWEAPAEWETIESTLEEIGYPASS